MAVDMEALASGMNEEIKRQGVVLEAYVRRITELEAAISAIIQAVDRVERIHDDGGLQRVIDAAEKLIKNN